LQRVLRENFPAVGAAWATRPAAFRPAHAVRCPGRQQPRGAGTIRVPVAMPKEEPMGFPDKAKQLAEQAQQKQ
jgi:hypothetical protein